MDGLRDAPSLPRLEILAWCFAIYLSLHLSLPNLPPYLPVFRVQILIQFAHQRKKKKKKTTNPTRSHESIGVDRCQESDTSFYFSLVMYLSLLCFFFFFFGPGKTVCCPQVESCVVSLCHLGVCTGPAR